MNENHLGHKRLRIIKLLYISSKLKGLHKFNKVLLTCKNYYTENIFILCNNYLMF